MLNQLFDFYQQMKGEGLIFCSLGPLNQQVIENLAATLRSKVELKESSVSVSMKVFSIFVEQVQNIVHYSADKVVQENAPHLEYRQGICMIGHDENGYFIISGNLINNSDVERIQSKIALVQNKNPAELKAYYMEQRKKGPEAQSKGAGLGLIDMVRKGKEIAFDMRKVNEQYTFFSIKVTV